MTTLRRMGRTLVIEALAGLLAAILLALALVLALRPLDFVYQGF